MSVICEESASHIVLHFVLLNLCVFIETSSSIVNLSHSVSLLFKINSSFIPNSLNKLPKNGTNLLSVQKG